MNKISKTNQTIETLHFIDSFWNYLYKNLGLSLKYSTHYTETAYNGSGIARINFDMPVIIQEDWMKRKTLEAVSGFLQTYNFNIQQDREGFFINRVVTNPTNLEHQLEEYLVNIELSDYKCRIKITDIAKKETETGI